MLRCYETRIELPKRLKWGRTHQQIQETEEICV